MSGAVQLRMDVTGFGVPLDPVALADLSEFEVGHILACLRLDEQQTAAVEAAVELVRRGAYPEGGSR